MRSCKASGSSKRAHKRAHEWWREGARLWQTTGSRAKDESSGGMVRVVYTDGPGIVGPIKTRPSAGYRGMPLAERKQVNASRTSSPSVLRSSSSASCSRFALSSVLTCAGCAWGREESGQWARVTPSTLIPRRPKHRLICLASPPWSCAPPAHLPNLVLLLRGHRLAHTMHPRTATAQFADHTLSYAHHVSLQRRSAIHLVTRPKSGLRLQTPSAISEGPHGSCVSLSANTRAHLCSRLRPRPFAKSDTQSGMISFRYTTNPSSP